jgi:hypothetical protein
LIATSDGEVRAVGLARCGDGDRMYYVDLLVGSYGPSVGVGCRAATR